MPPLIYLDHNATTPPLPEVIEEVARAMRECFGNPGSRHAVGSNRHPPAAVSGSVVSGGSTMVACRIFN